MWDQRDSYPACLRCSYPWWSPSSLISPFLPLRRPRPPFPLCLPWPSICFPISRRLLISASFTLPIFSQSSPDVLFNCICPVPSYSFLFLHYCADLCHSREPFSIPLSLLSPSPAFPGGVNWCYNGMLSEEPSSVSVNVCQFSQSHGWMSDFFVDIGDVIHLQYVLIWAASVYYVETSAPAVRV